MFRPLVLAVLFAPGLSAAVTDRPRPAVPLEIDARGGIVVTVMVGESGPYRFLLDTGTSRSIVSDTLARELAAPVVAKTEMASRAGPEWRVVVRLASLSIGTAVVRDVLAPVLPDSRLAEADHGVRGVLGQDFLSAFNYTLDYRRSRLTWDESIACDGPRAMRLAAADGRFVMSAVTDAGLLRLVPDSGTDAPILFRAGRPIAATSIIGALRVGDVELTRVSAVNVERRDPDADGLLPLHGFAAVSFAAGGRCMVARR